MSVIFPTPSVNSPSVNHEGSLRMPVGSAAEALKTMEAKDASDKKILRAVVKKFSDANIKPLENGQRVFTSTLVRNERHELRFLMSDQGRVYLRKVAKIRMEGTTTPIEVWSQESALVDRNNMLSILNEYAEKIKPNALSVAFAAILN